VSAPAQRAATAPPLPPAPAAPSGWADLYRKEDYWAIWLGLGLVLLALGLHWAGASLRGFAVAPPRWDTGAGLAAHFGQAWFRYVALGATFLTVFAGAGAAMGYRVRPYLAGFTVLFVLAALILVVSQWRYASTYNLEAPLVALAVGLLAGNLLPVPGWLDACLRTEFYVKTGIVLLGATLPFTLIVHAGPSAFLQATIVSMTTFATIYFCATRLFKLDRRFAACMGGGGSICGVSAAIAVGGAVSAEKEHVSITIGLVTVFAIVVIFLLPLACRALGLPPGVAGAWIGTSEFADAAGFAAASAIGHESAIRTFTLMKVIGRDIWIGIWSLALAIISVTVWERKQGGPRLGPSVIWARFPKFVIGFFLASALITTVAALVSQEVYRASLEPGVIAPIKTLRTWTFVFTFLSIGFTTRFRQLGRFGWAPFWAFTIGVLVNVPLGYLLSAVLFREFWSKI
jgi:uncharacterized integral membrane protein (TIGR00698 family)